ncbi:MAG: gluconokinase, GntK/IdnK-type [Chloroflexota bacterium]
MSPLTEPRQPITIVLMGVSGAGKSTIMELLARRVGAVSAEGDAFHSPANVRKMAVGQPLDDDDRWPWLDAIARWIGEREREGVDAIVTCSALRRRYRDRLRAGHESVRFVHLVVPSPLLARRLAERVGHYMPASLLPTQLEALESLGADEPGFEIAADRRTQQVVARIIEPFGWPKGDPGASSLTVTDSVTD